jgi:hypothetical protein
MASPKEVTFCISDPLKIKRVMELTGTKPATIYIYTGKLT